MIKMAMMVSAMVLAASGSVQDTGDAKDAPVAKPGQAKEQKTLDQSLVEITKPGQITVEDEQMNFEYTWPAKTVAIEPLNRLFEKRGREEHKKFKALTDEGKADASQYNYRFRPYELGKNWDIAAETPRFLSIAAGTYAYTGGAHGNSWFDSLVWDRETQSEMAPTGLFSSPAALEQAVREDYCAGLNSQRAERMGMGANDRTGVFGDCPALEELVVVFESKSGAAFDTISLLAAPYVAGSYA
ncbi:MAG: DUF4163 domain-containing protein, partial [Pseudomonadota bacterium]